MASIFDVAVIVLAVMVCVSMALLAWTLGVTIVGGLRRARRELIGTRLEMAVAERKLRAFMTAGVAARSRAADEGDE